MRKLFFVLCLTSFLVIGGWTLYHIDEIRGPGDFFRLAGQQISKLGGGAEPRNAPYTGRPANVVRIGSFNANRLNDDKFRDPQVAAVLSEIVRQFDVVAVQEVDVQDRFALKRFLKQVNSTGRNFRAVVGAGSGKSPSGQQGAFLYDASTIELEQGQYYFVGDPDNVLVREPLVGWFRSRTAPAEQAFTFTLVNVHFEPQSASNEMLQISRIFRAVRADGRQEDDVILAGDFGVGATQLNQIVIAGGLQAINAESSTSTQGTAQYDNLMIDPLATSEFTGDTGVYDFLKVYNLTLVEAMAISDHLPVWADFEAIENGTMNQVAHGNSSTETTR